MSFSWDIDVARTAVWEVKSSLVKKNNNPALFDYKGMYASHWGEILQKPESNLSPGIQDLTVRISLKIKYIFSSILALKNLQKPLKHSPIFSSGTACQWLTTNISIQNKQQEILLSYSSCRSPPLPFALSSLLYSTIANPNLIYGIFLR